MTEFLAAVFGLLVIIGAIAWFSPSLRAQMKDGLAKLAITMLLLGVGFALVREWGREAFQAIVSP